MRMIGADGESGSYGTSWGEGGAAGGGNDDDDQVLQAILEQSRLEYQA